MLYIASNYHETSEIVLSSSLDLLIICFQNAMQSYRSHRHFGFSCTAPASHKPAAAAQPSRAEFWAAGGAAAGSSEAPSTGAEKLEIPLPYQLPPVRYGPQDQPWMTGVEFPGLDSQGLTIHQSFDRNSHYGHVEPDD